MSTNETDALTLTNEEAKRLSEWQNRLIWWMVITPSLLIVLFIIIATLQLNRFNNEVSDYQGTGLSSIYNFDKNQNASWTDQEQAVRFFTLAAMEEMAMNRRYSQAGVLLMSRVLTKYFGFITGMILAIVGAVFIIAKLREDRSEISASIKGGISGSIGSSSPGIIFGLLGTTLMLATILQHTEINVKDMPLYLNAGNLANPFPQNRDSTHVVNREAISDLPENDDSIPHERMSDSAMRAARPH